MVKIDVGLHLRELSQKN